MKKFGHDESGWFCGFWNDSKLSIYLHRNRHELYKGEKLHFHPDFHEYYMVIDGELVMIIDGREVLLRSNEVIMVEPKEVHKILKFGPSGCVYAVVKSNSYDNSTVQVEETN